MSQERLLTEREVVAMMADDAKRWMNAHSAATADLARVTAERDRVRDELEVERMRLSACGVAALENTAESAAKRIGPDNPYYSASYSDVCRAVDREMALRAERDALAREVRAWRAEDDAVPLGEFGGESFHDLRQRAYVLRAVNRAAGYPSTPEGGK